MHVLIKWFRDLYNSKKLIVMWNSYKQNNTFLTGVLNVNNEDASAFYHWTLNLKITGHTEIITEHKWSETLNYRYYRHLLIGIHWYRWIVKIENLWKLVTVACGATWQIK